MKVMRVKKIILGKDGERRDGISLTHNELYVKI